MIVKARDWANSRTPASAPEIGGFHTPVERDVLRILLRGQAPAIVMLARAAEGWRAPKPLGVAIREAGAAGRARILSPFPATQRRTTVASAARRNRHILTLADPILIAHASPGGKTEALAKEALARGLTLLTFPSPHNAHLIALGAELA
ncbi:hypothetical protein [Tsuneonella aeria]|uniref:hypothetical protein n=1 Tax=Tsuneonella aeria TaxID=1837929 RepID=UPI001F3C326C|nr:hypothetical protein [Tsuneonella aeria]